MLDMKLTRRDALKALAGSGVASGSTLTVSEIVTRTESDQTSSLVTDEDFLTLEAVAETIYPSQIEVTSEYIETYINSFSDGRKESISQATIELNDLTRGQYGTVFYEMSPSTRNAALHSLGISRAMSRENGKTVERIRYHLVNTLLYALFTTPRGSELAGIQNPVGHPGGYESLMRSPGEEFKDD